MECPCLSSASRPPQVVEGCAAIEAQRRLTPEATAPHEATSVL
jgi:hypothetical protein